MASTGRLPVVGGPKVPSHLGLHEGLGRRPQGLQDVHPNRRQLRAAPPQRPALVDDVLEALGIRPEAQRRGLGTLLVQPMLDRADSEGVYCYLETSNPANVPFYERLGFRVTADVPLIPDGPPHFAMKRPVGGLPATD